jgi:putative SOS response-associated peptidase YedK
MNCNPGKGRSTSTVSAGYARRVSSGIVPDIGTEHGGSRKSSEEFTGKPAFRDAWKRGQRCLVITNGFYELKKLDPEGKVKQPYAIATADKAEMVMAGLWSMWK